MAVQHVDPHAKPAAKGGKGHGPSTDAVLEAMGPARKHLVASALVSQKQAELDEQVQATPGALLGILSYVVNNLAGDVHIAAFTRAVDKAKGLPGQSIEFILEDADNIFPGVATRTASVEMLSVVATLFELETPPAKGDR